MASPDMTEQQVKDFIRGIITSTPLVSTIQSIQRDYKDLIGQAIPFYKFKYNSLEHFLKNIPDVCMVKGTGLYAQVLPVISEKIAHINKLVTNQRPPTRGRRPINSRRSKAFSTGVRNRYIAPNNAGGDSWTAANQRLSAMGQVHSQVTSSSAMQQNIPRDSLHTIDKPKPVVEKICDVESKRKQDEVNSNLARKKLDGLIERQIELGNGTAKPDLSPRIGELSKSNVETWNNADNNGILNNQSVKNLERCHIDTKENTSRISFEESIENIEEDMSNVPKRVQINLRELISRFDEGIWASDLPKHYRFMFRKSLCYMEYGYTSLIDMCVALKHIFHYIRPGQDDFKLYDKTKPLPPNVEKMYTIASFDDGKKVFKNKALPDLDWIDFEETLPIDVFKFGEEIPNQFLDPVSKVEDILEVVVVEIYDPSKFWFYLGNSQEPALIDDLMEAIQLFYKQPDNARLYAIPPGAIREGLYCVQEIYGEYHRARIVKLFADNDEYVRVLYIDYGTVCKAPVKGMCFLTKNFSALPAQAIRCRLANIVPELRGHKWPQSTTNRFRQLVNRRDTKIKISYIDWGEEYVCVFLADVTNPKNVVYINERLVKEGLAIWEDERQKSPLVMPNFKCKVQNMHLFPTFLELEYGLAPSDNEMLSLEKMLVPLQFCIPQYFEPDEQVLSFNKNYDNELETSFIDTVKNHRRVAPWNKMSESLFLTSPSIDFHIFGDLEGELVDFCQKMNLTQGDEKKEEGLKTEKKNDELYNAMDLVHEDRELSDSIIKKLEKYTLLESELSTSPDSSNYNHLEKLSIRSFASEDILLPSVTESSMTEKSLSLSLTSSLYNINADPEINIFDNPEAFEDNSDLSDDKEPMSPGLLLKKIESDLTEKLYWSSENTKTNEPEDIGYQTLRAYSPDGNINTHNPFELETSYDPFDTDIVADIGIEPNASKSSNIDVTSTTLMEDETGQSNIKNSSVFEYPQVERDITTDKQSIISAFSSINPFRRFLELESDDIPTFSIRSESQTNSSVFEHPQVERDITTDKQSIISAFSSTNPFRRFLELEANDIPTFSIGSESQTIKDGQTNVVNMNTYTDHSADKEIETNSDESDYRDFEIGEKPTFPIKFSNLSTPSASSSLSEAARSDLGSGSSLHMSSTIPVPCQPRFPPWSMENMYYSTPQYTPWSNDNDGNQFMPYQQTQPPLRPPPGFPIPLHRGSLPGFQPSAHNPMMPPGSLPGFQPSAHNLMMPPGSLPGFQPSAHNPMMPPVRYPPVYYGPPQPIDVNSIPNEYSNISNQPDFYEQYNRQFRK